MDSFNKYSLGIYNKPSGGLAGVMTAVYSDNPFYQENFNLEAGGLSIDNHKRLERLNTPANNQGLPSTRCPGCQVRVHRV